MHAHPPGRRSGKLVDGCRPKHTFSVQGDILDNHAVPVGTKNIERVLFTSDSNRACGACLDENTRVLAEAIPLRRSSAMAQVKMPCEEKVDTA